MNWILCGNPNKLSQIQDGKDPDAFRWKRFWGRK
jgi:hypothetical protein